MDVRRRKARGDSRNDGPGHALGLFHPVIQRWFRARFGDPTDIQEEAWARIARGEHLLITAPTGSGKTLGAFLWAIHTLIEGRAEQTRVLYISPLKALNNDIRRNLEEPLAELEAAFAREGIPFPDVRVAVRSGDSPAAERRRMLREPPEIFITTPESLNILLTSHSGRRALLGFGTVILDEIHAVASTKRGVYLMTAIERLARMNGEFQRIALSATVHPLKTVAQFVGGREWLGRAADGATHLRDDGADEEAYRERPVAIVRSRIRKPFDIQATAPGAVSDNEDAFWRAMAKDFLAIVARNRSTLFFCNSRRMSEKVTRLINEAAGRDVAYAHHGSLSREIREVVEQRFRAGELAAIVATSSLELGIDIGAVDEVVLIQTPSSVSAAVQRIGRSGHRVGGIPRGTFYPLHGRDLADAAALAQGIEEQDIETAAIVEKPLDVLAQTILSMTAQEARTLDEIFSELRCAWPYRALTREEFDLVAQMLAGRYADARIRELRPRLLMDGVRGTAHAREGVASLLYLSGGVIPDRGYFQLRVAGSNARLGELDEEFVWERRVGDVFPFGNQAWQIERITPNEVEVVPASTRLGIIPFWRAEEVTRSFHLSERIGAFLEEADRQLVAAASDTRAYRDTLIKRHHLDKRAAERLIELLSRQRASTGTSLPHRHHLLIEHFQDPSDTSGARQTVLHTMWGSAVNRPLALALGAAWEREYGYPLECYVNNDCILLNLPHEFHRGQLVGLVTPERLVELVREKLEASAFFGARFRENAQRALLLPRRHFGQRMPLWLNRMRSKKLLAAVARFEDFPIVLETWRDCLWREFDMPALTRLLERLADGVIRTSEARTPQGSPFAEGIIWRQTNTVLYEDDSAHASLRTNLAETLLAQVVHSPHLRPKLSDELIAQFERKVRRLAPGYAPGSSEELLEWVKERGFIPAAEWTELLAAIERDHGVSAEEMLAPIRDRIVEGAMPLGGVIALEHRPRMERVLASVTEGGRERGLERGRERGLENGLERADGASLLASFLGEWLRFYGPIAPERIAHTLGLPAQAIDEAIAALAESEAVIVDVFREAADAPAEVCDRENLERLLRIKRAAERPAFATLPIEALPLFLAAYQGVAKRGDSPEALRARMEQLLGWPAKAALWESEILPARIEPYYPQWLDSLMVESDLRWFGTGPESIAFSLEDDLELFVAGRRGAESEAALGEDSEEEDEDEGGFVSNRASLTAPGDAEGRVARVLARSRGRMSFGDLLAVTKMRSETLAHALWTLAWQGRVTNDTFEAMRKGIAGRFRVSGVMEEGSQGRRRGFQRWKTTRPYAGNWLALRVPGATDLDALEREELVKDRIRVLFGRYGVLFRELLTNELPDLRWAAVFRTLRLMELSGEIVTGRFFEGIPGVQFCARTALPVLSGALPEDAIYWMNATDPASLCGRGIAALAGELPPRVHSTHLVFCGRQVVLVSRGSGRALEIRVAPDHPRLGECLTVFSHLLRRPARPLTRVVVEKINGEDAAFGPHAQALREAGFQADFKSLVLWRRHQ
ncbi:MAG: DEAD/DEAH box helicase [Candidatus Eisenbacteria bacterium]|nr:DEAD/DEAH box helicase [Candidatus Eisenbacteria bacterium]